MNIFDRITDKNREKMPIPPKNRLSKEELLRGKSSPEDRKKEPQVVVPGIYCPDDVLKRYTLLKGVKTKLKVDNFKGPQSKDIAQTLKDVSPNPEEFDQTNPGILKGDLQFSGKGKNGRQTPAMEEEGEQIQSRPLLQILDEWKARYFEEISKWRRYENKVNEWKDAVMNVLTKQQADLAQAQQQANEVYILRKMVAEKDQEILDLRDELDQVKNPK